MLGDQSFTEFVGQAIDKGMDLGLLAVLQVGHDVLEVGVVGHELPVALMEAIQFSLGRGLVVGLSLQGFENNDKIIDLLTW